MSKENFTKLQTLVELNRDLLNMKAASYLVQQSINMLQDPALKTSLNLNTYGYSQIDIKLAGDIAATQGAIRKLSKETL